ncbi:type VI secretion system baseplate subunit TssG [Arcobacter sp. LA11]|uniref:type VI secretion system baseplate subunit TssG n=1 Tax=Arcobacter sp. LA11 TaxID=1898176 RepID=UPI000932965D|nr:type VI secretion system baseplate subunit TssG [Arcobacter sp. LA11]
MNIETINKRIKESTFNYTLPQSIRIVCAYLKKIYPQKKHEKLYDLIIFQANPSLAFQKTEIDNINFIEINNEVKVELTLNFLGIFGSSSPMPSHFTEMILDSVDSDKILHDFLNLFNHHLQRFVFPIWKKHRYYIQYRYDLRDKFSKYILSFLGLYSNINVGNSSLDLRKLIPYIGILSMKHKSAGTLKAVIRHYLSHNDIEIIQCIPSKYDIPSWQYSSLGNANISLGSDFLIGESIVSKNAKFRVLLKDAKDDDLIKYSVLGKKMKELNDLISFSLNEPLEHDVCFEIKKENKKKLILNKNEKTYLGVNSWIGDSLYDENIIIAQKGK